MSSTPGLFENNRTVRHGTFILEFFILVKIVTYDFPER